MEDPVEIELKLECDAAGLEALREASILAEAGSKAVAALESTYFDLDDRRLRRAGLSLRVRGNGQGYVQTLKSGDVGRLARGEWEKVIPAARIDREALAGTPADALLKPGETLRPLFTVGVERRSFIVDHAGSRIEIALDEGRITATRGRRTVPVAEVELELDHGAPADLFSLARALDRVAPLRVNLRSKADRGYDLAGGADAVKVGSDAVALKGDMTAAEAFQAVALACLRHMQANEALLRETGEAEALHQTRVGLRRLRSALSLFEPILHDGSAARVDARLKVLAEPLGRARDLDVLLAGRLARALACDPPVAGIAGLAQRLEVDRRTAHAEVQKLLASTEWRSAILDVFEWINIGPWLEPGAKKDLRALAQPARDFAGEALEHRRRQVKSRGVDLAKIDPERRHRLRIAAKKLRYGSEFFAGLYDGRKETKRRERFFTTLKDMQEFLGDLNDIATAEALVARLGDTLPPTAAEALRPSGDVADLLAKASAAYESLVDQRPFWR